MACAITVLRVWSDLAQRIFVARRIFFSSFKCTELTDFPKLWVRELLCNFTLITLLE